MSDEERRPDAHENGPEDPVDRLSRDLGETADSVTGELRDLQDEMMPPPTEPAETITVDAVGADVPSATDAPSFDDAPPATNVPPMSEPTPPYGTPVMMPPPAASYRAPASGAAFTPEGTDDDRLMSMLAWLSMVILQLPIVSIIQLLSANSKDRPFQRHHAVTSLVFFGAAIVYEIVASFVFGILTAVTLGCGAICLWVIFFVPHALGLYYAFQAYGGKRVHLKYLSDWARQQGWL